MLTLTCPSREELLAYAAGRLPDETSEEIAAHLDSCTECQAGLVTLEDTEDTFVAQLRQPPATDPGDPFLEESQCQVAVARARSALGATGETPATAASRSLSGTILGEYELIAELGHGGMGTVYKALHTKLGRVVALKVLTTGRTHDPRAITRFEREMLAIGKLDHHHIVRAYDAREIEGTPVLVMEFIEGLDLTEIVRRLGPLPISDACEMARRAALGLQYVHEHGLVHRDIKPSNLMLSSLPSPVLGRGAGGEGAEIKILDLGLARFHLEPPPAEDTASTGRTVAGEITGTDQAMGTADYMAPEQVSNSRAADIRADIYSLGCTLFKLLTGRAPFDDAAHQGPAEKMAAHAAETIPPICQINPAVPASLATVLDRMLAKSPAARFGSPAEVAEALAPYTKGANLSGLLDRAMTRNPASASSTSDNATGQSSRPAASGGRRRVIRAAAVGLLMLGGLVWASGVVISVKKDGQESKVMAPAGAEVTVKDNGDVDVKLPPTPAAASPAGPVTEQPYGYGYGYGSGDGYGDGAATPAVPVTEQPGAKPAAEAPKHTIGIYLVTGGPKGVALVDQARLADLSLAPDPLIDQKDIFAYDWESHTIRAKSNRIVSRRGGGAFVLVLDGDRLYGGQLTWLGTPGAGNLPENLGGLAEEHGQGRYTVRLSPPPHGVTDPRGNARLKKALQDMLLIPKDTVENSATVSAASQVKLAFGPVIEHVISKSDADADGFLFFSFRSGKLLKPPAELILRNIARQDAFIAEFMGERMPRPLDASRLLQLGPEMTHWIAANDADVLFEFGEKRCEMRPLSLKGGSSLQNIPWLWEDSVPRGEIEALFSGRKQSASPSTTIDYVAGYQLGYTFETRAGQRGILQCLGLDTPRSVKFRYRLVQGTFSSAEAVKSGTESKAADPAIFVFGPVMERTLSPTDRQHDRFLDLWKGKLFDLPEPAEVSRLWGNDILDKIGLWMGRNEVSLFAGDDLTGYNLAVLPRPDAREWDEMLPADLLSSLQGAELERGVVLAPGKELPATFYFRTGNGTMGVLQIVGFIDKKTPGEPRGIKIRYKLLQKVPLVFGEEQDGLQAALELHTADNSTECALGQAIEDILHVRNTSKTRLNLAAEVDEPTVVNEHSQKLTVYHVHGAGIRQYVLDADGTTAIKGSGLMFLGEDMDAEKLASSVCYYVKVKPGRYFVSCRLSFHYQVVTAEGKEEGYRQGTCETALVTIEVKDPNAKGDSATSPAEADRGVLKATIELAKREAAMKEAQYKAGIIEGIELQDAKGKVDILEAELTGDFVQVAKAKLLAAQRYCDIAQRRYQAGTLNAADYEKAKGNVAIAEAELRAAEAKKQSSNKAASKTSGLLEFRIAPRPSSLDPAEKKSCLDWLDAGRIGLWWKGGRIAGRMPNYAWMPVAEGVINTDQIVTGTYQGKKYVLVSDKPGQTMTPGEGKDSWGLESVHTDKDDRGFPEIRIRLDERGGELFGAFSKANIGSSLAMIVAGKVVSDPIIRAALSRDLTIAGPFSQQTADMIAKTLEPQVRIDATKTLRATNEQAVRIELLVKHAPVTTSYLAELFELAPGSKSEYRLRADVVSLPILRDEKSELNFVPLGVVHNLPASKEFFIQWDGLGASTLHYYGPFFGDPLKVLGFEADTSSAAPPTFGPVRERILPAGEPCREEFFQFHSGEIFIVGNGPGTTKEEAAYDEKRIEDAGGVDMFASSSEDRVFISGRGCFFTRDVGEDGLKWDSFTAEQVVKAMKRVSQIEGNVTPTKKELPIAYLFKTARGEVGIMEVLGVADEKREGSTEKGMKFRYKLVQGTGLATAAARPLVFGEGTQGLQAALEVTSGEPFKLRIFLRNVSDHAISIDGAGYRQMDECLLTDAHGQPVPVTRVPHDIRVGMHGGYYGPGQVAVFESAGLSFQSTDKVPSSAGYVAHAEPGRYTLRFRIRLPGDDVPFAAGEQAWKGVLETGPVTLEVQGPSTQPAVPVGDSIWSAILGPAVECVVNDLQTNRQNSALSLDSGKLLPVPANITLDSLRNPSAQAAALTWARDNQVDAVAFVTAKGDKIVQCGLLCPGLIVLRANNPEWNPDTVNPLELKEAFIDAILSSSKTPPIAEVTSDGHFPANFMILDTRTHRRGVLQIMGVSDNPRSVKIRYRLVEGAAVKEAAAVRAAGPIQKAQWGGIGQVAARDGYLAWVEGKVASRPGMHVTSYAYRAYRLNLKQGTPPEMLGEQPATTDDRTLELGPGGIVAWPAAGYAARPAFYFVGKESYRPKKIMIVHSIAADGILAGMARSVPQTFPNWIEVYLRFKDGAPDEDHPFVLAYSHPILGSGRLLMADPEMLTTKIATRLLDLGQSPPKEIWNWKMDDGKDREASDRIPTYFGLSADYVYGVRHRTLSRWNIATHATDTATLPRFIPAMAAAEGSRAIVWLAVEEPLNPQPGGQLALLDLDKLALYPIDFPPDNRPPGSGPREMAADPGGRAVYRTDGSVIFRADAADKPITWENAQWTAAATR